MTDQVRHIRTLAVILIGLVASPESPLTRRDAADRAGVLVGTAVRPSQLSEAAYAATLGREFNMVEPRRRNEVVGCPAQPRHIRFWPGGRSRPVRPGKTDKGSRPLLTCELRDSIWYNRPGIGFAGNGTRYLEQAFRWAREADPQALLFYNEAEGEVLNRKSDAIYNMVRDFKRRGVSIDGVGLQLHISNLDLDVAALEANISRLAALGLQVHITELDVSLPLNPEGGRVSKDLTRQARIYRHVVRACLQTSHCTAIQTWGFTDKYSWIGSSSRGARGLALPLDRAYQPKPAYEAILEELRAAKSLRK